MFLVRRKRDGKWWKNNSYHSRHSWGPPGAFERANWVSDPAECKPFRNQAGARMAMYSSCWIPYWEGHHPPGAVPTGARRYTKTERSKLIRARFDAQFEIIPVTVEVKG